MRNRCSSVFSTVAILAVGAGVARAQDGLRDPAADWPMFHRDLSGTRYSPLTEITPENVGGLELAWTYRFNREGRDRISGPSSFELYQEITPIVVNGVMYLPSGDRVVALRPETGEEIWSHELKEGLASFRGVSYWPGDGRVPPRILFTSLHKLIALNASSGTPAEGFGRNGEITLDVPYAGAPTVYRNRIIIGANFFGPGEVHIAPQLTEPRGQRGNSRGFDAITGRKVWEYNTIPQPGEPGHETWGNESWRDRTGNNVWTVALTVDEEAGLVYMPVSTPGSNYYGGDRPGNNEPSNSVVALDAMTGEVQWYFQTIHHELWDYNLPPAAALIDLDIGGDRIPALAQAGKAGWIYILNRLTGEPVFGVEERPVPAGDVPGEWYSPTQPFPVKPPAVSRVSFDPATDIVTADDTNAAHSEACHKLWDEVGYYHAGPFTPFNLKAEGTPPSMVFPNLSGGVNWGGVAVDTDLGYIFVNSKDDPAIGWTVPNPRYNETTAYEQVPYVRSSGPAFEAPAGDGTDGTWPCYRPPWARLVAVNAHTGDIAWSVPLGTDSTMPEGKQNVGSPGAGGPIVTAGGVVFVGATSDQLFRAFDSRTGRELWSHAVPYNITAVPISYEGNDGRQYIAVVSARAAPGSVPGDEGVFVFAQPNK